MIHVNVLRHRWRLRQIAAHTRGLAAYAVDDALSNLFNRKLFQAFVSARHARRVALGLTLGIERLLLRHAVPVVLEGAVDTFELVADRYGHPTLRQSAHAFRWLSDRIKELPDG